MRIVMNCEFFCAMSPLIINPGNNLVEAAVVLRQRCTYKPTHSLVGIE